MSDGWTWQSALENDVILNARRFIGEFQFYLGELSPRITIRLYALVDRGGVEYDQSHFIHTPLQDGPYQPSTSWGDGEGHALHLAVFGLTQYFEQAVNDGHAPQDSWLVPNRDF